MNWHYSLALILSALMAAAVVALSWRRRSAPGAPAMILFMSALVIWSLTYAIRWHVSDLPKQYFWLDATYFGVVLIPVAFLIFVLQYTGRAHWLTRRRLLLLCVAPALTLILLWTDDWHGLFYGGRRTTGSILNGGPAFWFNALYSYGLLLLAVALLVRAYRRTPAFYRPQTGVILLGALLPWIGNVISIAGLSPFPDLDITPFVFTLSGLMFAVGLFYYHLLDVAPIARDKLVESMADGVIVLDPQRRIVDINPAAQRITQLSPAVIGQPAALALRSWPELNEVLDCDQETHRELCTPLGCQHIYDVYVAPLVDRFQHATGRLATLHDITQRKQNEEELAHARDVAQAANRAKSIFLASMSHELRTPLNAILGFSELMSRDPGLSRQQADTLAIINHSGAHLLSLINDVLDLAKIEAGRSTLNQVDFNLHQLLEDLVDLFRLRAEAKGLLLVLTLWPDAPRWVHGDQGKLRQVLINLMGNAVKFTETGLVELSVSWADDGSGRLLFAVQDSGPGIAPEELATIFDPFVQAGNGHAAREGTGLGLAISRQYVHLLGGELTAFSAGVAGQGSLFQFSIPLEPVEEPEERAGLRAGGPRVLGLEPDQPAYRLLVVEDHPASRQLLYQWLSQWGFAVRTAENGVQAVQQWEAWQPHLIWMDMRMPVMDGHEATRRIKATPQGQATVIIALSASVLEEERAAVLADGCDDFLQKPFRADEIVDCLVRHLGVRMLYAPVNPEEGARQLFDLAALPAGWSDQVRQAALAADTAQLDDLAAAAQPVQPALADALRVWINDYDYDAILAALNGRAKAAHDDL